MDPELIRWTPGMIRYFSGLNEKFSHEANWLNGYIHRPLNETVSIEYMDGYITREMQKHPDPFVELPDLDRFIDHAFAEKPLSMYMSSGYFPPSVFSTNSIIAEIVEMAFEYVQPKFVRKFFSGQIGTSEIFVRLPRHVTYSLIDRAEEMLPLAGSILLPDSEYVLSLRILTGRRIDPSLLIDPTIALSLMIIVAHPQLPMDTGFNHPMIFAGDRYSSVYYDIAHYIEVVEKARIGPDIEKVVRLYAIGKLWEVYSSKRTGLANIISRMDIGSIEKPLFSEGYKAILRQLRS